MKIQNSLDKKCQNFGCLLRVPSKDCIFDSWIVGQFQDNENVKSEANRCWIGDVYLAFSLIEELFVSIVKYTMAHLVSKIS